MCLDVGNSNSSTVMSVPSDLQDLAGCCEDILDLAAAANAQHEAFKLMEATALAESVFQALRHHSVAELC